MSKKDFAKMAAIYGFVLSRRNKHYVWVNPNTGARVISAASPSDRRALRNFEHRLRKATANPLWQVHNHDPDRFN